MDKPKRPMPPPRVSFEPGPEITFRLRLLASIRDISVAELIRQLVNEEVTRRNVPLDLLRPPANPLPLLNPQPPRTDPDEDSH